MTDSAAWPVPQLQAQYVRDVVVPGSKSLTNRSLVLAALGEGESLLTNPLRSRDTELMATALGKLGATIDTTTEAWRVSGPVGGNAPISIDCGLAGTVMRFVPLVASLVDAEVTFDGDPRARERPMSSTITALRKLGVVVEDNDRGVLPFTMHAPSQVRGGHLTIDASESSQFISAILLVAAKFTDGVDLQHVGPSLPSLPHIEMTVTELKKRGVTVRSASDRWQVEPGLIAALDHTIEPDLSNAGVFIGAAIAAGQSARVRHWPEHTDQAGSSWTEIVEKFGGRAERQGDAMVFRPGPALQGVDIDLHDVGELTPVVAALAALAEGPSRLRGIAHLRGHETDRLAAIATEINNLGGKVAETEDGLDIEPQPLRGGEFLTYHDHRMAHAGVVIGSAVSGVRIENIETTAKTLPGFTKLWNEAMV